LPVNPWAGFFLPDDTVRCIHENFTQTGIVQLRLGTNTITKNSTLKRNLSWGWSGHGRGALLGLQQHTIVQNKRGIGYLLRMMQGMNPSEKTNPSSH